MNSENGFSENGKASDSHMENSYGGFQYRWNYEEYQRTLARRRRKAAGKGMWAFCFTALFVFVLCFVSLIAVLTVPVLEDEKNRGTAELGSAPALILERQHRNANDYASADTEGVDISVDVQATGDDSAGKHTESQDRTAEDTAVVYAENNAQRGSYSSVLGIYGETVSETDADLYHIPRGVQVNYIVGTGMNTGLRRGDILMSIDGKPIVSIGDITAWEELTVGNDGLQTYRFCIFRDGEEAQLTVTIPNGEEIAA